MQGLEDVLSLSFVLSLTDVLRLMVGIVILFTLNSHLTITCLSIVPFFTFSSLYFASKYKLQSQKVMEKNANAEKTLSDIFMGIRLVKENAKEGNAHAKASEALQSYLKESLKEEKIFFSSTNFAKLLAYVGELLLLYFGIKKVFIKEMTIGSLFAFQSYLYYLYSPFQKISSLSLMFQRAKAAWERINELLKVIPEEGGELKLDEIVEVEVKNLSFSYNGKEPLLRNINFKIKKGEILLIKGPSGSGKSTLLKLLLGLYKTTKGSILYNGLPLQKLDLKWLRSKISFVSQDIFLFDDSIFNNIAFAKENSSKEEIINAVKLAEADEFIGNLPNGFQTIVGERGLCLSAGQRQRLSLARAILKNPDILILDEADAHLDSCLMKNIAEKIVNLFSNKIIIVVSHDVEFLTFSKILEIIPTGSGRLGPNEGERIETL